MSYEQPYAALSDSIIERHKQWKEGRSVNSELEVVFLHSRKMEQEFSGCFEGLTDAKKLLQSGIKRPILMLGLAEIGWVKNTACGFLPEGSNALKVLDWPGLYYLQYGDLLERLDVAFETAQAGVDSPVPQEMIQDRKPLCEALSDLHHLMIKNKKNALSLRKSDYWKACRGEQSISEYYLTSQPAFDKAGRDKLERLWALNYLAQKFFPQSNGLKELKCSIKGFKKEWKSFRKANDTIAASTTDFLKMKKCIRDALDKIDNLDTALGIVEEKVRELQRALECGKQRS